METPDSYITIQRDEIERLLSKVSTVIRSFCYSLQEELQAFYMEDWNLYQEENKWCMYWSAYMNGFYKTLETLSSLHQFPAIQEMLELMGDMGAGEYEDVAKEVFGLKSRDKFYSVINKYKSKQYCERLDGLKENLQKFREYIDKRYGGINHILERVFLERRGIISQEEAET